MDPLHPLQDSSLKAGYVKWSVQVSDQNYSWRAGSLQLIKHTQLMPRVLLGPSGLILLTDSTSVCGIEALQIYRAWVVSSLLKSISVG